MNITWANFIYDYIWGEPKRESLKRKHYFMMQSQRDLKWYAPLCNPMRNTHNTFGILTSNNKRNMIQLRLF